MNNLNANNIEKSIRKILSNDLAVGRFDDKIILSDQQNLLEFVDSFGFVNLIMALEPALGVELDLSTVDMSNIVILDQLIKFINESSISIRKTA